MRTLVHISDTHILPTEDDRLHGADTMRNLQDVLKLVVDNGLRPDALVVSGDLANGGELHSYRRLRQELEAFTSETGADLVVAMGNHDARPAFRQAMLDVDPSAEPVEYVHWIGGLRLIVLDSTVPGAAYGEVRREQLAWLGSELSTPAAEGSILILHHPPVPDGSPLAGLLTLHAADELEAVVRGSDVVAVLAGHAHHAITAAFGGAFCYAAPAGGWSAQPSQHESGHVEHRPRQRVGGGVVDQAVAGLGCR
jgi:Icc protein